MYVTVSPTFCAVKQLLKILNYPKNGAGFLRWRAKRLLVKPDRLVAEAQRRGRGRRLRRGAGKETAKWEWLAHLGLPAQFRRGAGLALRGRSRRGGTRGKSAVHHLTGSPDQAPSWQAPVATPGRPVTSGGRAEPSPGRAAPWRHPLLAVVPSCWSADSRAPPRVFAVTIVAHRPLTVPASVPETMGAETGERVRHS